jgi:hypothetical protein
VTCEDPLITRETVDFETPARRATAKSVGLARDSSAAMVFPVLLAGWTAAGSATAYCRAVPARAVDALRRGNAPALSWQGAGEGVHRSIARS